MNETLKRKKHSAGPGMINKYHEVMNLYKNNYSKAGVAPN